LFEVLRRFTPFVEEYSIDEAFGDLTGCGLVLDRPLESVAEEMRHAVATEMGLTVSVGISLTKTIAKLCSKFRKPNGQTIVRRQHLPLLLKRTAIAKVWGIGPASAEKLQALGIATAFDFTRMPETEVLRLLHKPGHATWCELQGRRMIPLDLIGKQRYASMMKGHTFSPPSEDRSLVFAEAMRNMVAVLAKLRRHKHLAREIGLCLRHKDYSSQANCASLPCPTCHDCEAVSVVRLLFDSIFQTGQSYRSTLVWLGGLMAERNRQLDLFDETPVRQSYGKLDEAVDQLNARYGQSTVSPAATLASRFKVFHPRDAAPERHGALLPGETAQRRLGIPRVTLGNAV
jgi:DNA polymerase-4/DNA polymerase V